MIPSSFTKRTSPFKNTDHSLLNISEHGILFIDEQTYTLWIYDYENDISYPLTEGRQLNRNVQRKQRFDLSLKDKSQRHPSFVCDNSSIVGFLNNANFNDPIIKINLLFI